jgi:serine/threonine protein phosphatase PrpC
MDISLSFSGMKAKCARPNMEDFFNIRYSKEQEIWVFMVVDGHGGKDVARYINDKFTDSLLQTFEESKNKDIFENIILTTVYRIEEDIEKDISCSRTCGSTFVCCIIYKNILYFINIGDSLITYHNSANIFFNVRHVPENEIEEERITKTAEIINGRIDGIINISRAFGDFRFKKSKIKYKNPMTVEPDIKIFVPYISNNILPWFLLGSDGLLIPYTEMELHKIVDTFLSTGYNVSDITRIIISYCKEIGNPDNTSLILVTLYPEKFYIDKKKTTVLNNLKAKVKKDYESSHKTDLPYFNKKKFDDHVMNARKNINGYATIAHVHHLIVFEHIMKGKNILYSPLFPKDK